MLGTIRLRMYCVLVVMSWTVLPTLPALKSFTLAWPEVTLPVSTVMSLFSEVPSVIVVLWLQIPLASDEP